MADRQLLFSLDNGLDFYLEDRTNRYFGDYHRVRLKIYCDVPVVSAWLSDAPDPAGEAARLSAVLGGSVRFEKILERMGTAGGEVDHARRKMLKDFISTARPYLEDPGFPARLLRQRARQAGMRGAR